MIDEVRVIEIPNQNAYEGKGTQNITNQKEYIILGMGSMAWSGGMYNCQPFCLHKSKGNELKRESEEEFQ